MSDKVMVDLGNWNRMHNELRSLEQQLAEAREEVEELEHEACVYYKADGGRVIMLNKDAVVKQRIEAATQLKALEGELKQIGRWCTGEDQIDLAFDDTDALGFIAANIEQALKAYKKGGEDE